MFNYPNNSTFPTISGCRLVRIIDAPLCTSLTSIYKRSLHLTYVRGGRVLALSRNQLYNVTTTHTYSRLTATAAFSRGSPWTGEFTMKSWTGAAVLSDTRFVGAKFLHAISPRERTPDLRERRPTQTLGIL